ncbi:unnamed protein product [Didymodactylos carnosus]|uniref:Fe2OG dioxygenase domain-containing protein n=1 Tax=Didymodactylos carnosus TaxID=1234261 RepID=A0A814I9F2_9BILA|nr:unnamed protein product [Didymodactylos carnosus]CAF3791905.1 unnamed protein product [Didymodactylos carnosus]
MYSDDFNDAEFIKFIKEREIINSNGSDGCCLLHHAVINDDLNIVKLLISNGANIECLTMDKIYYVANIKLCILGNQTPLHLAIFNRNVEITEYLIKNGANQNVKDNNNNTPDELSSIKKNDQAYNAAITKVVTRNITTAQQTHDKNDKSNNQIISCNMLESGLSNAFSTKNLSENIFNSCSLLIKGVYSIKCFSTEDCNNIINYVQILNCSAPNTMNNYGIRLSDNPELKLAVTHMIDNVINKFCIDLFQLANDTKFEISHSFIIKYKLGEDIELKEHQDDSFITLNICLGKQFTGSQLYFYEENTMRKYTHMHNVGYGILHFGNVIHGVEPLTDGERWNLVLWLKCKA